jgi:hypothetical protein
MAFNTHRILSDGPFQFDFDERDDNWYLLCEVFDQEGKLHTEEIPFSSMDAAYQYKKTFDSSEELVNRMREQEGFYNV